MVPTKPDLTLHSGAVPAGVPFSEDSAASRTVERGVSQRCLGAPVEGRTRGLM